MEALLDLVFSALGNGLLQRLAVLLGLVGALWFCLLFAWRSGAYKHRAGKLPPGSLGLPLLGETLHFLFSRGPIGTPQPFFSSRLRRYGAVFKTHLLGRPTIVSMDPELSKFLLANEEKLVQAYLPHFITKLLGPTVCLQGASHRAFRELANLSVNYNAIQKLHLDAVQEHYLACLRSWYQGPSSPVVDAQEKCREWAFTYSVKYFLDLEHDDPITAKLMQDFFLLLDGVASIPINLPGTSFNKALKASKRINYTIGKLVRSRRLEARKEGKDFLDILLKRTLGSGEDYGGLHVADWIYAFVLGAYENTALLLANMLKFLSENEHVIHELQRENFSLKSTKTNKEKLTWEDYQSMCFTKNVVKETLRMASIAPFVFRLSLEDICFKGVLKEGQELEVGTFELEDEVGSTDEEAHQSSQDFYKYLVNFEV